MRALHRVVGAVAAVLFCATIAPCATAAPVNLVKNGGFEAGDFTNWTQTGNTTFNAVFCPGAGDVSVAEGDCAAFFGPVGTFGGITQTISSLIVGEHYRVAFFLQSDGTPDSFNVTFGGVPLASLTNIPGSIGGPYKFYAYYVTATSTSEALAFNFRDDGGFMLLDGVTVLQGVPEPSTLALFGISLVGLAAARRRRSIGSRA